MPLSNKYICHSRISEAESRQILQLFCLDLIATQIEVTVGISRDFINTYLKVFDGE